MHPAQPPCPSVHAGQGDVAAADEGGTFWLPGGVVASFRMVGPPPAPSSSSSSTGGSSSGNGKGRAVQPPLQPRGLVLSLAWLVREGMVVYIEREYEAGGQLLEVRSGSAVKGAWAGGRM